VKFWARADRALRWAALVATAGVIVTAVLLPNTELRELRRSFPGFSQVLSWLDHLMPSVDLVHVLCFAALTVFCHLTLNMVSEARRWGGLFALSAISELVQFWVPGREPSWSDLRDDATGILIGASIWFAFRAIGWCISRLRHQEQSE
jgi:hypothetical protein